MKVRTCRDCGRELPLHTFPKNGTRYRWRCRRCYRAHRKSYGREWRRKNAVKHCKASADYRARKRMQTLNLTPEQNAQILEFYERARRLTLLTGVAHHVDHIHPLKHPLLCGLHVPWNLQVIPSGLNRSKSNKLTLDTLAGCSIIAPDAD